MKSSVLALTAAAALAVADNPNGGNSKGGDPGNGWSQASSQAPAAAPQSAAPAGGWTDWVTSVQYVPTTIFNTVTNYITVTLPPVTETETETAFATITQVNTVFETAAPVTVVSIVSSLETIAETQTVENDVTVTNIDTVTVTSQALTGLVTCPSRIINPTYTPPTPLPSNYLWGCPPGKLCHPKRENCNFEQNLPADTYVCAPEECMPVAELPPLETWLDYENVNDTCAWLTPIDDYFNINPTFFGLDFDIFDIYGQSTCSPVLPASTVTVDVSAAPVILPTTVTVTASGSNGWQAWQSPPSPSSAGKAGWPSSAAAPQVTKRATLADRDLQKKSIVVASECYAVCDYAAAVYQSIGNAPALCSADGQWSSAFARVTSCTSKYTATGVTSVVSALDAPILYCNSNSKRSLFGRRVFGF